MRRPSLLKPRRSLCLAGVLLIALGEAGACAFRRHLDYAAKAHDFESSEHLYRARADVCEELATNLRAVASLAREMAGSSTIEFEKARWLEMARQEEIRATRSEQEALRLMSRADVLASKADDFTKLAWRPWLEPPK